MRLDSKSQTALLYRIGLSVLLSLQLTAGIGCHRQSESKEVVSKRDINAVMTDHTAELMAIPGVTGVAIGQTEDKTPCILVLVVEKSDELVRKIPKTLEGHPVRLLVSGVIRPMQGGK